MSVLVQAQNFLDCGFLRLKFIATWDQGCKIGLPLPENTSFTSIHSSFPQIVVALLKIWGFQLPGIRLVMLIFSTSAIFGVFLFVRDWTGKGKLAFLSAFGFATLPFFRLLADNLTVPYDIAVRVWFFYLIAKVSINRELLREKKWLLICAGIAFLNALIFSVEIIPSVLAFAGLAPFAISILGGRPSIRETIKLVAILGVGYFIGAVIRLLHLFWVLGSFELVSNLVISRALRRLSAPELAFTLTTFDYVKWLLSRFIRLAPLQSALALFGFFAPWFVGFRQSASGETKALCVKFTALFLSEVMWFGLFRQHSAEHDHTVLQMSISLAFLCGVAIYSIEKIFSVRSFSRLLQFGLASLLVFQAVSLKGVKSLQYNVQTHFDASFLERQTRVLAPVLRGNIEIVNMAEPISFPPFYLVKEVAQLPRGPVITWRSAEELHGKRYLVFANPFSPTFNELIGQYRLVGLTRHYALFDPQVAPSFLNHFVQQEQSESKESVAKIEETWLGNIGLVGFWLSPTDEGYPSKVSFYLPHINETITWLVIIPAESQTKTLSSTLQITFEKQVGEDKQEILSLSTPVPQNEIFIEQVSTPFLDDKDSIGLTILVKGDLSLMSGVRVFLAPVMSSVE
ncbi:hypothetical protein [Thermanaerothrix daxensis]|nr:hypothetical protein [Thermanaerothrix daxensis]